MPEKVNADKPQFQWTRESLDQLRKLKGKGLSDYRCAQELRCYCTEGQVRYAWECLRKTGHFHKNRKNKLYTQEEDAFIEKRYCEDGWLIVDIAEALGRNHGSVRARVGKLGLQRENTDEMEEILKDRRARRNQTGALNKESYCVKQLWTVRSDRDRAKLYDGCRYEDADVPKHCPPCGRLG